MSKKLCVLIIVGSVLVALGALTALVAINFHHLYVWTQNEAMFCTPIDVNEIASVRSTRHTLAGLKADERVKLDQSLMLVNKQYLLSDEFIPDVFEYNDTDVYMSRCMLAAYAELSAAVMEHTGKKLYVSSDLRSADEQQALYDEDPLTATVPGASEHQTGLALDVYVAYYAGDAFIKSSSGRFVNSNSWKYGFIIRYPSYAEDVTGIRFEPWHVRYVGHPHADIIYNNHTTLEEYISSLEIGRWYEAQGYLICRQQLAKDGTLALPEDFESCVISPDNTGCYIVTVKP